MAEIRGGTVCRGCAKSSAAYRGSGDRRTSKSSHKYHSVTSQTKCHFPPFPRLHNHIIYILRSGLTLTFSKLSHTRRVLHLMYVCSLSSIRAVVLIPSFPGDLFTPALTAPSNVHIKSSVLGRWEMAANGSVARTSSLNKSVGSSTHLPVSVSTPAMPLEWLTAC